MTLCPYYLGIEHVFLSEDSVTVNASQSVSCHVTLFKYCKNVRRMQVSEM